MMEGGVNPFHSRFKKTAISVMLFLFILTPVMAEDKEEAPPGWETTLALGMNLARGNSDILSANVHLDRFKETDVHEFRFGAFTQYNETDGKTSTQNAKTFAIYKRKFNRAFAYTDNSLFHDKIGDIKYRLILGAGGGYYVVMRETKKLGLEAGLSYIREKIYDVLVEGGSDAQDSDLTDNIPAIRLAERYDHTLSETAKLWQSLEYLPDAGNFGNYLLHAEAGVEAALNTRLNLRFVVQDRYDSEPPTDLKKNDVAVMTALVFKF